MQKLATDELHTMMGGYDSRAELESRDPHALAETESYKDDLQQELQYTLSTQQFLASEQVTTDQAGLSEHVTRYTAQSVEEVECQSTVSFVGLAGKQLLEDLQDDGGETEVDEGDDEENKQEQDSKIEGDTRRSGESTFMHLKTLSDVCY